MNAGAGAARHRRTAAAAIAVVAVLLTSGCAAGRVAQTQNQRPSKSGVDVQVGPIAVRNLTVEAPQGNSYPVGSTLRLDVVLVNNGTSADQLTDISSPAFSGWGAYSSIAAADQVVGSSAPTSATNSTAASPAPTDATPSSAPAAGGATPSRSVSVPSGGRTSFGVPDATGSLLVTATKSVIYPGSAVTMSLTFAHAGTVTVRVPVNITTSPGDSVVPGPSGGAGD